VKSLLSAVNLSSLTAMDNRRVINAENPPHKEKGGSGSLVEVVCRTGSTSDYER
jgi:hypothetical protein